MLSITNSQREAIHMSNEVSPHTGPGSEWPSAATSMKNKCWKGRREETARLDPETIAPSGGSQREKDKYHKT